MTTKSTVPGHAGVQDICRKLKEQLEALAETINVDTSMPDEEKVRRKDLMDKLKQQLAELSV